MRKIRIYTPQSLSLNSDIELDPGPAHHVGTVLRMTAGDALVLFNGDKGEYQADITYSKKGKIHLHVKGFEPANRESPLYLHLYQGVSKGDHMDFSIQKAVELGVKEITPVLCDRSQFKMDAKRLEKKMQHWQHIIVSAAQQSWRCELPTLNPPAYFNDTLSHLPSNTQCVLFDVEATKKLENLSTAGSAINCWIGPEGGFSAAETDAAKHANIPVLSLGPRILRTETATVTALSLLQYFAGDLQ